MYILVVVGNRNVYVTALLRERTSFSSSRRVVVAAASSMPCCIQHSTHTLYQLYAGMYNYECVRPSRRVVAGRRT